MKLSSTILTYFSATHGFNTGMNHEKKRTVQLVADGIKINQRESYVRGSYVSIHNSDRSEV